MSIKYRVIILLTSLASIYVLLTSSVLRFGVLPAFAELEKDFARQDSERVKQFLAMELERLDAFALDWSFWTETQEFMVGLNPYYEVINLTDDATTALNANILVFVDTNNNIVWEGVYDLETGLKQPFSYYFDLSIADLPQVFGHHSRDSSTKGYINGPGPPIMFASRPIMDNDGQAPIAGTLVWGRIIDQHFVDEMGKQLSLDIGIWDTSKRLSSDRQRVLATMQENSLKSTVVEEESQLHQLLQFDDVHEQAAFILEITTPRRILAVGTKTVSTVIVILIAALTLFMLTILFLLDRLIIDPLRQLRSHILRMQVDQDLSQHINFSRSDEFGDMAREFNELTAKLHTSSKESEAAKQAAIAASESKSNFLATMSHEIRTPMNGVLGMADLLLSTSPLSEEQQHYAKTICHSGGSLLRILNDILDFSKIEAGKFILEENEFNLRQIIEDTAELVAHEIQRKGLELIVDVPPDLHDVFIGDEGRIRQMLLNLLSNAVKFTDTGYICLRVTVDDDAGDPAAILFEIEDTGIGIKEKNQAKLFSSFTQEDASTTRRFGGTGLGLAVTRQLAELMGGAAGMSSVYGSGSTFWIQVPLQALAEASVSQRDRFEGLGAILYMDESLNSQLLKKQLEYWGVRLHIVNSMILMESTIESSVADESLANVLLFVDARKMGSGTKKLMNKLGQQYTDEQLTPVLLCLQADALKEPDLKNFGSTVVLYEPIRQESLSECFTSSLAASATSSPVKSSLKQEDPAKSAVSSRRVLLVEDNRVNVMVAENMLKKLHCEVTTALNGQEAVELCSSEKFDVVLMDCAMPVMDGFEATRKIREAESGKASEKVTIIALTANTMSGDRDRCLEAGMDDFLSKPISMDTLSEKIEKQIPPLAN